MVDAIDLLLVEYRTHRIVDRARAVEVVADGFLDHHAGVAAVQVVLAQPLADVDEDAGASREIEHPHAFGVAVAHQCGELLPASFAGGVECAVADQLQEGRNTFEQFGVAADRALERFGDARAVIGVALFGARHADDAAGRRDLVVHEAAEQRGQQLAHREVAGAAEDGHVERGHGLQVVGHGSSRHGVKVEHTTVTPVFNITHAMNTYEHIFLTCGI